MSTTRTPLGLNLYGPGERWYRGRLWSVAMEHGADSETLARAYNVSTDAISKGVERYRRRNEQEQGQGHPS